MTISTVDNSQLLTFAYSARQQPCIQTLRTKQYATIYQSVAGRCLTSKQKAADTFCLGILRLALRLPLSLYDFYEALMHRAYRTRNESLSSTLQYGIIFAEVMQAAIDKLDF